MTTIKLLQQQAYEYLQEKIQSGELSCGEIYSETKIAEQMGLSRTPMRDALQRLCQNRIVDIIPSKGFMVHRMTAEDVIETYQVRGAVEGYAATLIARESRTPSGLQSLDEITELFQRQQGLLGCGSDNVAEFTDVDQMFHTQIVAYARNRNFDELFSNQLYRIHTFAISSFECPHRKEAAVEEHQEILSAMRDGDQERVYRAVLHHMEGPRNIILARLAGDSGMALSD